MQMNSINQRNRLQNTEHSTKSNKMASGPHISPLLQPSHAYHGVGSSRGEINIFLEFSKLCGLFYSTFNATITCCQSSKQAETSRSRLFCIQNGTPMQNDLDLTNDEDQDEGLQASSAACKLTEPIYKVYELDSNGNPSEETPCTLNAKTLELFKVLKSLNISFRIEIYKPKELRSNLNSNIFYCKNLFLKDRKGQFYLTICHEDQNINLKQLRKDLKAYRNFNFATAEDMLHLLDVEPGGVSPLALMREESAHVSMVICKSLLKEGSKLMFHPLDSNLAIEITMHDLVRFLKYLKHPVTFLEDY